MPRRHRIIHRITVGSGPTTNLILLAGLFVLVSGQATMLVYGLWPHKVPHLLFNIYAYGALVLLFLAWLVLLGFGRIGASTGAGFGIAAAALALRAACDLLLCLAWKWPRPDAPSGIPEPRMVEIARDTGVVAYVLGLALVIGACIAEWRLCPERA